MLQWGISSTCIAIPKKSIELSYLCSNSHICISTAWHHSWPKPASKHHTMSIISLNTGNYTAASDMAHLLQTDWRGSNANLIIIHRTERERKTLTDMTWHRYIVQNSRCNFTWFDFVFYWHWSFNFLMNRKFLQTQFNWRSSYSIEDKESLYCNQMKTSFILHLH